MAHPIARRSQASRSSNHCVSIRNEISSAPMPGMVGTISPSCCLSRWRRCHSALALAPTAESSPAPEIFFQNHPPSKRLPLLGGRNHFWTGFWERGHEQFSRIQKSPLPGVSVGQRHRRAGKQLDELSPSHARPSLWAARFPLRPHLPCQTASAQAFAVRSPISPSCMQLSHRP